MANESMSTTTLQPEGKKLKEQYPEYLLMILLPHESNQIPNSSYYNISTSFLLPYGDSRIFEICPCICQGDFKLLFCFVFICKGESDKFSFFPMRMVEKMLRAV